MALLSLATTCHWFCMRYWMGWRSVANIKGRTFGHRRGRIMRPGLIREILFRPDILPASLHSGSRRRMILLHEALLFAAAAGVLLLFFVVFRVHLRVIELLLETFDELFARGRGNMPNKIERNINMH